MVVIDPSARVIEPSGVAMVVVDDRIQHSSLLDHPPYLAGNLMSGKQTLIPVEKHGLGER